MGSDSKQVLVHIEAFGFSQCPSKSKRESHSERYLFFLWVNMHDWMTLQITITCRYTCSSEQLELIPTKQWSTGEARCTQWPENWTQGGALWLWCAWFLLLVDHIGFELSPSSNLRSCWENFELKRDSNNLIKRDSHKCFSSPLGSLRWIRNVFSITLGVMTK